ncbi:hypothetical protein ACHAQJ_001501 [Trichoderma viride]
MKSLSAGCRGLGELLGLGKISWEAPNISEARSKCIYALDLMAGIHLGSQDEEAAVSPDRLESETSNNPLHKEPDMALENLPKDEMNRIDMDEGEDLERRIEAILTSQERSCLTFTEEDEIALFPPTTIDDQICMNTPEFTTQWKPIGIAFTD